MSDDPGSRTQAPDETFAGQPGAGSTETAASSATREKLIELLETVKQCRQCSLAETRTNVVFGAGNAEARLMFVGEAPGYHEDQQARPFVGAAGKLLEKLLQRIGLTRQDVFIANVLKCRPPDNRDPLAEEIELCRGFLDRQIDIIQPLVICTLGNFSTKLLSGKPAGITQVRGAAQPMPGHEGISLFPVYHPAAALYTRSNLAVLEKDFDTLAGLIGATPAASANAEPGADEVEPDLEAARADAAPAAEEVEPAPEAPPANPQAPLEESARDAIEPQVTPEVFAKSPHEEPEPGTESTQLGLF